MYASEIPEDEEEEVENRSYRQAQIVDGRSGSRPSE